jgi:type IV secretion system protein VirB1
MEAIAGAALAALLQTCAPDVAPSTMHAIVAVESGGKPWALNDNTSGRRYEPRSYAEALSTARDLIGRGHSVDVGIAQVNSSNFAGYRVTPAAMLMPCQNLIIGSAILSGAYRWSAATYGNRRRALWGAVSAYNTGSLTAGSRYVDLVVSAARRSPLVPSIEVLAGYAQPAPAVGISGGDQPPERSRITRKPAPAIVPYHPFFYAQPNPTNLARRAP